VLPNLIIIGAGKAGTTALHHYLGEHPQVFMSRQKELQLFHRDDWRRQLPWYESQFPVAAPVRGEGSPVYTLYPAWRDVPSRMRQVVPEAKLIYLVRDPVERFVAHYVEHFALGFESRPFAEVAADLRPENQVLAGSRYATQLEQFLDCFPSEQILVIDQEELRASRNETLAQVFRFVGVDERFRSDSFGKVHNQRKGLRYNGFARWLHRRRLLLPAERACAVLPSPLGRVGRRAIGTPIPTPVLDDELRSGLVTELAAETARFRELTGRRFESWSL
jgi:Sulfotransferase domain